MIRSPLLLEHAWLDHGFGTRHDGAWTPPERTARMKQIHSAVVGAAIAPGHCGEGDALVTAKSDLWLEMRTADCVPILLADPARRVVAAVHAGWRGTVARVAAAAVERMANEFECEPDTLHAAIGPAIGACCFEVGDDVAAHFPADSRPTVDLIRANARQLAEAGLRPANIETLNLCTRCDADRFHSFRRDRSDGRMVSAIRILA
ncbi:MAG: peptidoglycan editing factor PgeF [Acidobacteria bacterium]|nr:peptidoglycan editing factor PgeF [Acidobacteriota bacterium]